MSLKALEVQTGIQRAIPGEQKILLALEMSVFTRDLAKERIRRDHPFWNEMQVDRELLRIAFLPKSLPANF
jgi:hypothetical protein